MPVPRQEAAKREGPRDMPNRLFVCYYGEEPDGISCIQGTYVDLTS